MSTEDIRRYTADELREMVQRGESRSDWARVDAMTEEELKQAIASDPDWADIPENWYEQAELVVPKPKVPVSIRLDADLIEYFRGTGRGWQTRVNAILRAYKEAKGVSAKGGGGDGRRTAEGQGGRGPRVKMLRASAPEARCA